MLQKAAATPQPMSCHICWAAIVVLRWSQKPMSIYSVQQTKDNGQIECLKELSKNNKTVLIKLPCCSQAFAQIHVACIAEVHDVEIASPSCLILHETCPVWQVLSSWNSVSSDPNTNDTPVGQAVAVLLSLHRLTSKCDFKLLLATCGRLASTLFLS